MSDVKISELSEATSLTSSHYFIVDDGIETKKINSQNIVFSFVGMVVQGTNLATLADVQAIYGSDTTWRLMSNVALASENVLGNGKALALTQGSTKYGVVSDGSDGLEVSTTAYGKDTGGSGNTVTTVTNGPAFGVPTKTQLGVNPEYSGLIVDTITIYMWERTA